MTDMFSEEEISQLAQSSEGSTGDLFSPDELDQIISGELQPTPQAAPQPAAPENGLLDKGLRALSYIPQAVTAASADLAANGNNISDIPSAIAVGAGEGVDYVMDGGISPLERESIKAAATVGTDTGRATLAVVNALASIASAPALFQPIQAAVKAVGVAQVGNGIAEKAMALEGVKAVVGLGKGLGGQSVKRIKEIGTKSTDIIHNLIEGKHGGLTGFDQATWRKTGEILPDLEDAMKTYAAKHHAEARWAPFDTIPKSASVALQDEIKSGKMSVEAGAVSNLLKAHGGYLQKNKTIDGALENWLPDKWDVKVLQTTEGAAGFVKTVLKHHPERTIIEARQILSNIIERDGLELPLALREGAKYTIATDGTLMRATSAELPEDAAKLMAGFQGELAALRAADDPAYLDSLQTYRAWVEELSATVGKDVIGKHGSTMNRELNIPYADKQQFLQADEHLYDTLSSYIQQTTKYTEFGKRFGLDYSNANKLIEQAQREKVAAGGSLEQADLDKIYGSLDALVGVYKPLTDSAGDKVIGVANKVLIPAMYVLTLPLATISSISEVVMPLGRAALRPSASLQGFKALAQHVTHQVPRSLGLKSLPKHDATRAVEELGIGLDEGIVMMMGELHKGVGNTVSKVFFKANFLHQWTRAMMVASNATGKAMIEGHLKDILAGKGSVKAYKDDLSHLGVSWEDGVEWIKRGATKQDPFYDKIKHGGLNFVTDTVMMPRSSVTPRFASNPRAKLFMQLKSFPISFGNTVLHNFVKKALHGTAKERMVVGTTVGMATTLGMLSTSITDEIRYEGGNPRHKEWEAADYLFNGFERFGGFGMLGFAKDAYTSSEFGSDPITAIAGPSVSFASGTVKAGYRALNTQGDWAKPVATQLARLTPLGNITKASRAELAQTYRDLLSHEETTSW